MSRAQSKSERLLELKAGAFRFRIGEGSALRADGAPFLDFSPPKPGAKCLIASVRGEGRRGDLFGTLRPTNMAPDREEEIDLPGAMQVGGGGFGMASSFQSLSMADEVPTAPGSGLLVDGMQVSRGIQQLVWIKGMPSLRFGRMVKTYVWPHARLSTLTWKSIEKLVSLVSQAFYSVEASPG